MVSVGVILLDKSICISRDQFHAQLLLVGMCKGRRANSNWIPLGISPSQVLYPLIYSNASDPSPSPTWLIFQSHQPLCRDYLELQWRTTVWQLWLHDSTFFSS